MNRIVWPALVVTAAMVPIILLFGWMLIQWTEPLPPCTDYIADNGGMCQGPLLPQCPTEDADNCYWDASVRGNGEGRSFYVIEGEVTYVGE